MEARSGGVGRNEFCLQTISPSQSSHLRDQRPRQTGAGREMVHDEARSYSIKRPNSGRRECVNRIGWILGCVSFRWNVSTSSAWNASHSHKSYYLLLGGFSFFFWWWGVRMIYRHRKIGIFDWLIGCLFWAGLSLHANEWGSFRFDQSGKAFPTPGEDLSLCGALLWYSLSYWGLIGFSEKSQAL